jgi:hypothetical protein
MYPQVFVEWQDSNNEKRIINDIHETWEGQPQFLDCADVLLGPGDFFKDANGEFRF